MNAATLKRESDKYDTCPLAVLKAACGLPIRGRAARERARRAATALGLAPGAAPAAPDRVEAAQVRVAIEKLSAGVEREALALALTDGLAGFPVHPIEVVASILGANETELLRIVTRAREQLAAASRPPVAARMAAEAGEVAA